MLAILAALAASAPAQACTTPNASARLLHLAPPDYPELAAEVGAHGTFDVRVVVSKTGRAVSASVPGQHPHAGLDSVAIAAAKASTYAPAVQNCRPVQGTVIVPVVLPPKNFKPMVRKPQ